MTVDIKWIFNCDYLLLFYICNWLSAETMQAILCIGKWSCIEFIKDKDMLKVTSKAYNENDPSLDAVPKGWNSITII